MNTTPSPNQPTPQHRSKRVIAGAAMTVAACLVPVGLAGAQPTAGAPRTSPTAGIDQPATTSPTDRSNPSPTGSTHRRRDRRAAALEALASELGRSVDEVRAAAKAARSSITRDADRRTRRREFVEALARTLDVTPHEIRSALRASRSARVTVR